MAEIFSLRQKRIWVAGHNGLVGDAVCRRLQQEPVEILTTPRASLDLTRQQETENWIAANKPDVIIIAAARVGGIKANSDYPAEFLFENIAIAQNIIHAAFKNNVRKLVFLGSSCIYPKYAEQPIKPESLLTGALEPTNEAYAIAKIAGIKLCQFYRQQYGCDFISIMPCNLYGRKDRWDGQNGHVIPALIHKMHEAKYANAPSLNLWGSGRALREFLHADDLADGVVKALQHYTQAEPLNIGSETEITIADLAQTIAQVTGYEGELVFDHTMPDGTPRKVMDSYLIRTLGWQPWIDLNTGLQEAYAAYLQYRKTRLSLAA